MWCGDKPLLLVSLCISPSSILHIKSNQFRFIPMISQYCFPLLNTMAKLNILKTFGDRFCLSKFFIDLFKYTSQTISTKSAFLNSLLTSSSIRQNYIYTICLSKFFIDIFKYTSQTISTQFAFLNSLLPSPSIRQNYIYTICLSKFFIDLFKYTSQTISTKSAFLNSLLTSSSIRHKLYLHNLPF